MKKSPLIFSVIIVILLLFYVSCTSVVMQSETAVLMSFGKPVKIITEPGIYLKLPYPFHRMEKFDRRLLILQPRPSEFLTADKKNLIMENAICYRITDPVLFMKTVRDKKGLEIRLTDLLSSHTGLLLGHIELSDLVNINPKKIKFEQMNGELTAFMKTDAKNMGVEVKQVFIKRIMFPDENRYAVFERMRAERKRIATKYIAEGEEKAQKIKAEANMTSRIIIAEAKNKAAVIKGQAEAEAMKIYGEAYQKNQPFYSFIRSLESYEKMFNKKTVIILDEESPVLDTFFSGAKNNEK